MGTAKTYVRQGEPKLHRSRYERFLSRLQRALQAFEYPDAEQFGIMLACQEALDNAHKHGNGGDASKTVNAEYHVDKKEVCFRVEDQGDGFDPTAVPDPTSGENLEKPGGRGLLLMRQYMDVQYSEKGNAVELRYPKIEEPR